VSKVEAAAKGLAFIAAQIETVSPLCLEPVHADTTEADSVQLKVAWETQTGATLR
jgi:hypothetical protein